ncbi:MAG TPA: hypothetical protein VF458_10270, partial [Ktedonobacteraceae bacterium]
EMRAPHASSLLTVSFSSSGNLPKIVTFFVVKPFYIVEKGSRLLLNNLGEGFHFVSGALSTIVVNRSAPGAQSTGKREAF